MMDMMNTVFDQLELEIYLSFNDELVKIFKFHKLNEFNLNDIHMCP